MKRNDLIRAMRSAEPAAFTDQNNFASMLDALKSFKRLEISLLAVLANLCCRFCRKSKDQRLFERIQDYHNRQLDIRSIMSNLVTVQDFLSAFLTKNQKVLLAHQKSRVLKLEESSDGSGQASFGDKSTDAVGKFNLARFKREMAGVAPADDFEWNLALGVLEYRVNNVRNKGR